MARALGLLSGGLDSMLAARLLSDLSIEVLGLSFVTPFFGPDKARKAAKQLQIPLTIIDLTTLHWAMLKNPRHGFGKNLNPCIDCHALMLQEAGKLLGPLDADFLFTGEVLGQRPFSQTKPSLRAVEKTSGYVDLILRPLSALLLPETRPEREGLVDRSRLLDISGRSRKRQMALAEQYGLKDYPNPAGGCLLTDPLFSRRLKELWQHAPDPDLREVALLKVGRHFRLASRCKVVIGRNQKENELLEDRAAPEDGKARTLGFPGPLALAVGRPEPGDWEQVARLTAAYSDGPTGQPLAVQLTQGDRVWNLQVPKMPKEVFQPWML
ncbi:MAG: tRNA 4-thiouridine(8) synthase ThiI [Deltaproteobacteria bacterium]|nr:tRNA 4-thiouridine(8) synthase ThiI [Deltaproteobacteria bacterium]